MFKRDDSLSGVRGNEGEVSDVIIKVSHPATFQASLLLTYLIRKRLILSFT